MPQRILGIDLGTHTVKVAELDVGFNLVRLAHLWTLPVLPGPATPLERSLEALRGLTRPAGEHIDEVAVGTPGDLVLLRLLQVPTGEARKVGALVGNELADDLPWEMEQVVYDHTVLPILPPQVLAVAARSADVKLLLTQLAAFGLEARSLPVAPLCYAGLLRRTDPEGTVLVADLGHRRSNLCLIHGGRALAARTISRGGHQITEALRQAFQLSYAEAEALKEREGRALEAEDPGDEPGTAVTRAVALLARDIGLTLAVQAARLKLQPERVVLCGGTSLLPGIDTCLASALGLPTSRLSLEGAKGLPDLGLPAAGQALGAQALALALDQGTRQRLDLRRGEFAYRTDSGIFKDKLITIAVSVVLVLVFAALNAYMSLRSLRAEEKQLTQQLKRATQQVMGEVVLNPKKVSRELKLGSRAVSSGVPSKTAFDILLWLSSEVPPASKVKLDFTRLEIKPGKTYITGTADTRSAVGDVVKELERNKCFGGITTGTISDVSEGKKQFSLTINTECF